MDRKDWTLLVVASVEGDCLEPVQLQKALFLLGENLDESQLGTEEFYRFRPYHYGPFCVDIYHDADELASEGLVVVRRDAGRSYRDFVATATGVERAKKLEDSVHPVALRYLEDVVCWVRNKSFMDLVRSIYEAYPEMKARSVFHG